MPKLTMSVRPDKKLTDFFGKKPGTGSRPSQPIYDVSSPELQSIISISSDDVLVPVLSSQLDYCTRGHDDTPRASPRSRGNARSRKHPTASSSKLSEAHSTPVSDFSIVSLKSSANDVRAVTGVSPHIPAAASQTPKKSSRKRKQQPISLISSEESDGPIYPSIHVNLPPKKSGRELKPSPQLLSPGEPSMVAPIVPLTPRQNILSQMKCSPEKPDSFSLPATPSKNSNSPLPAYNQHSPSKRARHDLSSSVRLKLSGPGFDADDESEDQAGASSKRLIGGITPTIHFPQQFEADTEGLMNDEMQMDVEVAIPYSSPASGAGVTDGANQRGIKENEEGCNILTCHLGSNASPREETREVVPSSQQNETELQMDYSHVGVDDKDTSELSSHPALPTVSPIKARTENVIARIRAKAEADAAAQAEGDCQRLSLGLLGSDESDLSSLSSPSNDEDELELELELSAFGKGNTLEPIDSSSMSAHVRSPTSQGPGTRRSTRHLDGPAPNYAKRLELFREDSPPPPRKAAFDLNRTLKTKTTIPEICPLDILLKDHAREGARKARIEAKRKADFSSALGSETTPGPDSSVFKTPERVNRLNAKAESPSSDSSLPRDGNVFQDILMDTTAREELLGKDGAEAVGKILDDDRKKSVVKQKSIGVSFWRDDTEGVNDALPQLVTDQSHVFLTALTDAIKREEYGLASLLVDSGALASIPLSVGLLDWLFSTAMSAANSDLSLSAYRALLVSHRNVYSAEVMSRAQLDFRALLISLFKLGMNANIARLLGMSEEGQVSIVATSQQTRMERVCRFLTMLEALGRSQGVDPVAIPSLVCALLLLSLDPSATPELQQDAVSAIEAVLTNPNVTPIIELDTCKSVLHAAKELGFQPDLQVQTLALLPGCSPSSGRVRRWIAWAMLGGDLQDLQECADVPPIQTMVNLFSKSSPGDVKLEVTPDTNYEQLGALVNILSVAMTDVNGYVRRCDGSAMTKKLCEVLDRMNGKIVDTRAAHIDRTRTKEAINRLHKRLVYQRHAVLETMRTKAGNMEQFLVPKSGATSRPKLMKSFVKDS